MRTEEPGTTNAASQPCTAVDLYWIPLGAGQHVVKLSGRLFEAISARVQHRRPCDLYHSALVIIAPEGRFVIEQTPISDDHGARRGVVVEGAVGSKLAGRFRLFRYEIRRWRDGVIPDIAEAVLSPVRLTDDPTRASEILNLVPSVPPQVWGRDEGHTGDMWNCNSVISWLLAIACLDPERIQPPPGGRAPGWRAGLEIATRGAAPPASAGADGASPSVTSSLGSQRADACSAGVHDGSSLLPGWDGQGVTANGRIMSLSSCSTMWQW